jgi:hypothetical protein
MAGLVQPVFKAAFIIFILYLTFHRIASPAKYPQKLPGEQVALSELLGGCYGLKPNPIAQPTPPHGVRHLSYSTLFYFAPDRDTFIAFLISYH